jgi:hypothetical protein
MLTSDWAINWYLVFYLPQSLRAFLMKNFFCRLNLSFRIRSRLEPCRLPKSLGGRGRGAATSRGSCGLSNSGGRGLSNTGGRGLSNICAEQLGERADTASSRHWEAKRKATQGDFLYLTNMVPDQSNQWIRVRIRNLNSDPGGQK